MPPRKKRLLLLDRSELVENMLRLLLIDSTVTVAALHQTDELESYLRKYPVELLVVNSNFLEIAQGEFLQLLQTVPQLQKLPKIFLYREDEHVLQQKFAAIPHVLSTVRPFHPEAFKDLVNGVLQHV